MSALTSDKDRRGAGRYALPKPVPATFGGFPATLVEFSLTGCRIEHVDRVTPRVALPLRFAWRGREVRIQGTLVRSEMIPVRGKPGYESGLEFCEPIGEAAAVVRDIVNWLIDAAAKKVDAQSARPGAAKGGVEPTATNVPADAIPLLPIDAEVDDEPETLSTQYLQCTFSAGRWEKLYVEKPKQPVDGFTILAGSDEREVDVLCRAYQTAGIEARRAMRASFELAIARKQR